MSVNQIFIINNKNLLLVVLSEEIQLYDAYDLNYFSNIYYDKSDLDYFFKINDELFLRNNFQLLEIGLNAYGNAQIMSLNYKFTDEITNKGILDCEHCIHNSFANVDEKTFICLFGHSHGRKRWFSLSKMSISKNNYLKLEKDVKIEFSLPQYDLYCYDTYDLKIKIVAIDKLKKQIILGCHNNLYFYDLINLKRITHIKISLNREIFIFQNIKKRILYCFCPLFYGGIRTYLISLKNNSIKYYENILDSNIKQYIYKVFYLDYSKLFLFEYTYHDLDTFILLIYKIENNKFKFMSKKYLINKKEIIDIKEIDKQGNILILTFNKLNNNNEILLSNCNNLFLFGISKVNFRQEIMPIKLKEKKKLEEAKELEEEKELKEEEEKELEEEEEEKEFEEDYINRLCKSIEMKINKNNNKKKHKKLKCKSYYYQKGKVYKRKNNNSKNYIKKF